MTVRELIELLKENHNPDSLVVVSGYEGGYDTVTSAEDIKIELNVNTSWYYGKHERTSKPDGVSAVLL